MSSLQSNPWATGASYISVGGLQRVLKIAQSPAYRGIFLDHERRQDETESSSSLLQIQYLKQISKLDEKVNKLHQEIQQKAQLQSTSDLTNPNALNAFLSMLEDLCNHLQAIMDNKHSLIGRLQEAYDDHLTIDAEYHRDVVECFSLVANQLALLSQTIDSITWTSNFSIKGCHLNSTVSKLSSRLAEVQSYYQALDESRALMQSKIKHRSKELETSLKMKNP